MASKTWMFFWKMCCRASFFSFFGWFFFSFAHKTYGTLKMFLLSTQNNFYIILSSYIEEHVQKNSSLNFMSWFPHLQSGCPFGTFNVGQVLRSFLGKNNSLKPPVFGFSLSLPNGLEESRKLRALISSVMGE